MPYINKDVSEYVVEFVSDEEHTDILKEAQEKETKKDLLKNINYSGNHQNSSDELYN